jgi:hypothetical protein
MKRSEIVIALADLASKVSLQVTPGNIRTLAEQTNTLFADAARLINELEAEENANDDTDGNA